MNDVASLELALHIRRRRTSEMSGGGRSHISDLCSSHDIHWRAREERVPVDEGIRMYRQVMDLVEYQS